MAFRGWPGMADFIRKARIPDPGETDPRYSNYQMRRLDDPRSYQDPSSPLVTTPPFNPEGARPPVLPAIPAPPRIAAPMPPAPQGGEMPLPEISRQPSRRAELEEAREVYLQGPRPGRLKSGLMGALRGGLAGLASGGGLGGGLGGAVAGAGFGAIHPRGAMEMEFAERIKPKILERFAIEDEERAAGISAEDRQLANEERRARIANLNRQNQPQPLRPRSPISTPRGLYDQEAGAIIPNTGPLPKDPAPSYRETYTGKSFNIADPAQRAEFDRIQSSGPRDKFGRFISRADERVTARGSGGEAASRRDEQNLQRQTSQAAAGVAGMEKLAREAMESPEARRGPIFNQMRSMAANLQAQFPDQVETGKHNGWPFARLRRREAPRQTKTSDPLGIR